MTSMLGAALALVLIAPSIAQAKPCEEAGTQIEVNDCFRGEYEAADAAMSASYRKAVALSKDDQTARKLLLAAQRAWLTFRDAQCASEAGAYEGGSIKPAIEAGCLAELSRERERQLRALVETR